jgi:hydrogenase maturation protease
LSDPESVFLIGVGNRNRGDDAVGLLAVDEVVAAGTYVRTYFASGDLSDLALRWQPGDDVVVVDAMISGRPPGSIVEIDALATKLGTEGGLVSSHGVGLAEAVELARMLDRLPRSLKLIAIEAASFGHMEEPTPAVAQAAKHWGQAWLNSAVLNLKDREDGRSGGALSTGEGV